MPVENQVRELDARLLLACVAAKRGLASILGPKRKIESHIASFPKGIFLSKSLRIARRNFFSITRMLGHEIVAWDEEALVHLPPETYYSRRLSPVGNGARVSHVCLGRRECRIVAPVFQIASRNADTCHRQPAG